MNNKHTNHAYHTHISSRHRWYELNLKEVWQYRDLIVLFTKRNFTVTYKQTILGPAWLFLNPLISSLIYAFVFGRIAGKSAGAVSKNVTVGKLSLDHVAKFEKEIADAGIVTDAVSPKLLPDYTRKVNG